MRKIDIVEFNELIKSARYIRSKLKRELKFNNSTMHISSEVWSLSEMLPIYDKSGNHGVLLVDLGVGREYIIPFDISLGIANSTGRNTPITCDFCRTWRSGSQSGSITFPKGKDTFDSIRFLCCGDLKCSMNARNMTAASIKSKTQIREGISVEDKVERLRANLDKVIGLIGLELMN